MALDPAFAAVSPRPGVLDTAAATEMAIDPDRFLALLTKMAAATDRDLADLAARLANRLVLDLARNGQAISRGVGKLTIGRADRHAGDIDLDRSLEALTEARQAGRVPRLNEIWVQRWLRPDTAIALVVDSSGSMSGTRLGTAAVMAAACALRAPEQWSALVFGHQVVAVKSLEDDRPVSAVVDDLLRLRGYGTTDLDAALNAASVQLSRATASRRVTLLMSDCRHTSGVDPLARARCFDDLCVVAPADDAENAAEFATMAGARFATVDGPRSILNALTEVLPH